MFYLIVPIMEFTTYELYKILPLPFSQSESSPLLYYYNSPYPFLVIAKDQTRYDLQKNLSLCRKLFDNFQLCKFLAIQTVRLPPYIVSFFLHSTDSCTNSELCSIKATTLIWEPLDPSHWLFSFSVAPQVQVYCEPYDSHYPLLLPKTGILYIPPKCRIQSRSKTIWGYDRSNNSNHTIHTPAVNLTIPKININQLQLLESPSLTKIDTEYFRSLHMLLENERQTLDTGFGPVNR